MINSKIILAEKMFAAKKFQHALQYYLDVVRDDSQNALVYERIAECYLEILDYKKTISFSLKTLELDRNLAMPHALLAYAYLKTGRNEVGFSEAKVAYDLQPESDKILACYGTILLSAGKTEDAITFLLRSLSINPNLLAARINLSVAYRWKGDRKHYLAEMRSILKQQPSLKNLSKLLNAYLQQYSWLFGLITTLVLPLAYIFKISVLLLLPAYVVLKGWAISFQYFKNHQWVSAVLHFVGYTMLGVLVCKIYYNM